MFLNGSFDGNSEKEKIKISAMKTKKNVWRDSGDVYDLFKIMKSFREKGQQQKEEKKFYITRLTSKLESSLFSVF